MILAIDTGNTNIVLGCIEDRKIRAVARMATDVNKTDYEYAVGMKNVLAFAGFQPESLRARSSQTSSGRSRPRCAGR